MQNNQILLIHGTDYQQMAVQLLEAAGLDAHIGDKKKRIALKPNLVVAGAASDGAVTHPELIEGTIRYLQGHGFDHIGVIEGSWVGARTSQAVRVSGIEDVCKRYGVPFVDLQKDGSHTRSVGEMKLHVCNQLNEVDFLINMPVLKGHCQTTITCALKNAKGLIPDSEKRRFHTMGLHRPIACLNKAIKQDFILVDNICGDLDFEEGGNPVVMNRIFACLDPVLCDAFVCETMGYAPGDVPYIQYAEKLGVGKSDVSQADIVMLNPDAGSHKAHAASRKVERLAKHIDANDACSACYGSLIYALDRLDEQGRLRQQREKICIGQGWKQKAGGVGVGACTNTCEKSLPGCPPRAVEMVRFLEENWR